MARLKLCVVPKLEIRIRNSTNILYTRFSHELSASGHVFNFSKMLKTMNLERFWKRRRFPFFHISLKIENTKRVQNMNQVFSKKRSFKFKFFEILSLKFALPWWAPSLVFHFRFLPVGRRLWDRWSERPSRTKGASCPSCQMRTPSRSSPRWTASRCRSPSLWCGLSEPQK